MSTDLVENYLVIAPKGGLNDCFTEFQIGIKLAKRLGRIAILSLDFNRHYKTTISELFTASGICLRPNNSIRELSNLPPNSFLAVRENLQKLMQPGFIGYFDLDNNDRVYNPSTSPARFLAQINSRGGVVNSFSFLRENISIENESHVYSARRATPALHLRCGDVEVNMLQLKEVLGRSKTWILFSDCDVRNFLAQKNADFLLDSLIFIEASSTRSASDLTALLELARQDQIFLSTSLARSKISGFGVLALTLWLSLNPMPKLLSGKFLFPYIYLFRANPLAALSSFVVALVAPIRARIRHM